MNLRPETSRLPDLSPETLTPGLGITDPGARWWTGQAVLRLRREVAWQRHLQTVNDPAQAALDLLRHRGAKEAFFASDVAARYLSDLLGRYEPEEGRFHRLATMAGLSVAERFTLALAILAQIDGALGPVCALCQNDAARPWPTLALAQALWDDPIGILEAVDPMRPLRRLGLIDTATSSDALLARPVLARFLCSGDPPQRFGLTPIPTMEPSSGDMRFALAPTGPEVVTVVGSVAADSVGFVAGLTAGRVRLATSADAEHLPGQALMARLLDADLYLARPISERAALADMVAPVPRALDVRVFVHVTSRDLIGALPPDLVGPVLAIPSTTPKAGEAMLRNSLGTNVAEADLRHAAQSFRLEPSEIRRIAVGFGGASPDRAALIAACRAECDLDFHGLAEPLNPRYSREDIVLPPAIDRQFDEALAAIRGALRLHHDWDVEGKMGVCGIPLLFAGVPGTGKTMAAEVIAHELDLPLYRIDLSQVVNKYIGETEKNLKRVFDAAEKMRCILFFDEADALFGKRSEVKDANDRFANIETGYLLQRMDEFSGVSVLATNRRKDLDEAFSRRLRYVIEFPVPGVQERLRIWEQVFPVAIDASDLDLAFLARQFQIAGGHIRSIAVNAALQAAARDQEPAILMRDVLIAVRRELDKLNRKSGADAFGPFYEQIEELRA